MTEAEWTAAQYSDELLRFIEPRASDRKLHYFAIACARRIAPLLPCPASLQGVDVLERFVEGQCGADAVSEVSWKVEWVAFDAAAGGGAWLHAVDHLDMTLVSDVGDKTDYP